MRLSYIGAAMRHFLSFAVACAMSATLAGCFSDRLPPPNFRFSCSVDDDCSEPEACIRGLCQIPCRQATFRRDCPSAGSYAACLNGVCSNVCTVGEGHCPPTLSCLGLPFDAPDGNGNGGFGGGGAPPAGDIGICGVECTPGDDVCPQGETCLFGFCLQICEFDEQCQDGFSCVGTLCLPEGFEFPGAEEDGTGGTPTPDDEAATGGAP